MKIRYISISNFRGINHFEWGLPADSIFCLVGKGDSSKSTILEAIRYCLYPNWNLSFFDSDFFNNDVTKELCIELTIGEIIPEFISDLKYGLMLRGWSKNEKKIFDEPDDSLENVLTIRLSVGNALEPKWIVVNTRYPDGIEFKTSDRIKACVGIIGAFSEKQLSWSSGSAIARITEADNIDESLVSAAREAKQTFDANRSVLTGFDQAAKKAEVAARHFGVHVSETYKAQLDISSINLKVGGIALHDKDIPLRLLGLGSRRLVLCGIQQQNLENGHITLIDEIEYGLEPNRISRLIKSIRNDKSGQYFITTHSPIVLRELTIDELYIVHNYNGEVTIQSANDNRLRELEIQGKIRANAEAFLSKKVIVCEGATEVGFLRGFDDYLVTKAFDPFAYFGVALVDANGGGKVKKTAQVFKQLGYEVAVFADSDAQDQLSDNDCVELKALSISTFVWAGNVSIEERIMLDIPWNYVLSCLDFAISVLGIPANEQLLSVFPGTLGKKHSEWPESQDLRKLIGKVANKKKWFKNITNASILFFTISELFDSQDYSSCDLFDKMEQLKTWILNDE